MEVYDLNRVRFGIIGCGVIAPFHAKAVKSDPRAELVAVCDIVEEKARVLAKDFNVEKVYTDYRIMLEDPEIDAVCICVPSGLHGECTIAAAKSGKHIFCEKPIDIKKHVIDEMIKAANENKVKLGCVFQNRTRAGLIKAKQIIDRGDLGKMTIVECQYRGYRSPEYYASAEWRGTWDMDGGGCLMNQGVHAIDAMCWLAGEVKSVYAVTKAMLRDIEVEDTAIAVMEFKNGALGALMGTTISNVTEKGPEGDRIRIEFEKGSIVYAEGKTHLYLRKRIVPSAGSKSNDKIEIVCLDENDNIIDGSSASDNTAINDNGHEILLKDLVSSILEDRPPYITGESARKAVDFILAVYESSKSGNKVYL